MKLDRSRIKTAPYLTMWVDEDGPGSILEKGEIDYTGLSDQEKMALYVYAWNIGDFCPTRSSVMTEFGWTKYKVRKIYTELKEKGMYIVPLVDFNTGLFCGRGYSLDHYMYDKQAQ